MDTTPSPATRKRQPNQCSSATPKARKVSNGSIDARTFNFTPRSIRTPITRPISSASNTLLDTFDLEGCLTPSSSTVSSDVSCVTPVTLMSSDVRKRLNLFDPSPNLKLDKRQQYLSDLGKIVELPNCLCAVGCMFDQSVQLDCSKSSILSELPDFLGYYKGQSAAKSFSRIRKKLLSLSDEIRAECEISSKSALDHHVRMQPLDKDDVCEICSSTNQKFTKKDLKSSVQKFYNTWLDNGKTGQEIHSIVSKINNSVYVEMFDAIGDTTSRKLLDDLDQLRAENAQIRENLEKFHRNLNSHAALLYFATPIPHRQIDKLDKKLFCHPKHKMTPDEILKHLPNISSVHSSISADDLKMLATDYEIHLDQFGSEQPKIFTQLGEKYQIRGSRNGTFRMGSLVQSIVLHHIKQMEHEDEVQYHKLFRAFEEGFRRRSRLEQFELCGSLKFPRLPSKKTGVTQLNKLVEDKEILVGQSQESQKLITVNSVTGERKEISVDLRKLSFDELREFTLHKHKKYHRAKDPSRYEKLDKSTILTMLKDYGVHDQSHDDMEVHDLQNLVKKLETTREIGIWYDHATIANSSHILFTFQIIYNPATYECPAGVDIDDMQKEIETPEIYMLGMSKSSTEAERSFDEMRLVDVLSLSTPKSIDKDGVHFHDVFRVTFGDNPVRCSETGQNKSGPYRLCSLPLKISEFQSYNDLLNFEHLTISDKRSIASKGNYFDDGESSNLNFNLQEVNSREYCTRLNIAFTDAKDAAVEHEKKLSGIKSMPAMLSQHPYTDLSLLNLQKWMVFPMEVLHDLKGVVKKSFAHIPGTIHIADDDTLKSIHKIVHRTGDELYLLKDNHSAETLAKALINICEDLETKFFPFGLSEPCMDCGHLLTISSIDKCLKCSVVGYYRVLCEIQLYGYKHESKRNAHEVVRLHNLTFLLFKFLEYLDEVIPRFSKETMIRCAYFVNVEYYLAITVELHNSMSFNAGRHEDMFNQLKNIVRNLTNHQLTKPQLLLNSIRRVVASRYYNGTNFASTSSQYSKRMSCFLNKSPPPPISYSKEFIEQSKDFPKLVQRLSTFVVNNTNDKYVTTSRNNLLVFNYQSCKCNSDECLVCQGKVFPSYGINNLLVSNIKKILDTKASVFDIKIRSHIMDINGTIVFEKLLAVLTGNTNQSTIVTPGQATVSEQILSNVTIDVINDAQVRLPQTFRSVLSKLPDIQHRDYGKLKNSFQVKCLAKIYGTVDTDLIIFDKVCGSLESIQKQYAHIPHALKDSVAYYEAHKKYITLVRKHIHKLNSFVSILQDEISSLSLEVDQVHLTHYNDTIDLGQEIGNSGQLESLKKLENLQKRMLAYRYAVQSLYLESNANMLMETEYDEGLF